MNFEVRRGTRFDVDDIIEAATEFYSESNFRDKVALNEESYRAILTEHIDNQYVASYIARGEDDRLLGYAHIYCQNDYTKQMIGELYQFFVRPEARGTGVARALVSAAVEQYKKWGCVRAYAEASPGFYDGGVALKQFENLWKKFDYQPTGVVMMMEL